MVLVSVIVPVYKVEQYLHKCIDSILVQTYKNLEIILVDDGSPDNCGRICDEYALYDERVKVIHKVNGGLSDARNAGLDVCTGEYIAFVDSDDWIDEDYIATFMEYAALNTIVCCGYKMVYDNNTDIYNIDTNREMTSLEAIEMVQKRYLSIFKEMNEKYKKSIYSNVVWNKLYPKEVFCNLRFPTGKVYEDAYICFETILKCKKFIAVNNVTYNYLIRDSSISHNKNSKDIIDFIESRLKQEDDVKEYPFLLENSKKITLLYSMYFYSLYFKKKLYIDDGVRSIIKNILKRDKTVIFKCRKNLIKQYLVILYFENVYVLVYKIKFYLKKLLI